ncbi:MAG: HAMP domain-containing protein [Candidatus Thiodiazotropha sp. (ex Myrtea sp. 'scaly one' KF741663)]|nr:HAMP domain-containing protein [Candidatus Thiodiazotropha sp. (ex Myrtea sp. 'scaly one' KF741663)]
MKFRLSSSTLFGRTAQAFTLAFLVFSLFSISLVIYFVTLPLTKRVANDLSAMVVLTAQIWVELPPGTRPDFEREMREHHQFIIGLDHTALTVDESPEFYIDYFLKSLNERTRQQHKILSDSDMPEWRWIDIAMGGRTIRVGFNQNRFVTQIPLTMIVMVLAGTLIAVVTSLLIVRRITQPLAALVKATTRVGEGKRGSPLEERGAVELTELTRNFNHMEEQLHILMENRTTLLAGISHDLRTPISRMQLELELLDDDLDRQLIKGMRDDLGEMNEIITTTLQLSKGMSEETSQQSDLCQVLNEVVEEYEKKGGEITCHCAEKIAYALPLSTFRRVVNNLIDNAIRYSETKPVRITCTTHLDSVCIEIIDQGPGIPGDQRRAVFQPFMRLEDSRNRASGGSGLGLAIVDQLCRMNDWQVELDESTAGGTVARIRLPIHTT